VTTRGIAIAELPPDVLARLGPHSPLRDPDTIKAPRQSREAREGADLIRTIFGRVGSGDLGAPVPGLPAALALLYHVPNNPRSAVAGARLKANGMRRGFPDYCLPVARGPFHGLYFEFKPNDGQGPRAEQRAWLDALAQEGYAAAVVWGVEAALALLLRYESLSEVGLAGAVAILRRAHPKIRVYEP